jgi:DNA recombination protein RmuC
MPLEYIILVLVIVLIGVVVLIGRRLSQPSAPDPRLDEILATLERHRQALERLGELPRDLDDVRTRLVAGGEQQKGLREYLSETRRTIDEVGRRLGMVSQTEDKNAELLGRLHRVLLGTSSRGRKGENLLREQLAAFPPSVLATNFHLSSGVVEFALRLPDDRVLPIDSKWPEPEMLERLEATEDAEERARLKKQIESKVLKLIGEIKKYIDPEKTTALAVGALPDSVYALAGGVHYSAFREGVLLVPYSNAVPILLAIYGLFLKYAQTFDMEQIKGHLGSLDTLLIQLDKVIDNQLARGGTMVANATEECRNLTGKMRRSLAAVSDAKPDDAKEHDAGTPGLNDGEET